MSTFANDGFYVEVPGDCIHFPGNEHGKDSCTKCKVKPRPSAEPPDALRMSLPEPAGKTVWVHASCALNPSSAVVARFDGYCHICHDTIDVGEDIVPDE